VTQDGANIAVSGLALDAGGNHASTTIVLKVDRVAPRLMIASPFTRQACLLPARHRWLSAELLLTRRQESPV